VAKFNSIGPKSFRGELPPGFIEPSAIKEYKSRSMIEEYRGLAIVFATLALALAGFIIKWILTAPPPAPPPVQSFYIETVVPKAAAQPQPQPQP
jgi:hypothetical protein